MKFDPVAIAHQILRNVADVDAQRITWDEFSARNFEAWREVDRDEPNIIGSACDKRVSAVHAALRSLSTH